MPKYSLLIHSNLLSLLASLQIHLLTLILSVTKLIRIIEDCDVASIGHAVRIVADYHEGLHLVDVAEVAPLVACRAVVQLEAELVTAVGIAMIETIQNTSTSCRLQLIRVGNRWRCCAHLQQQHDQQCN